MKEKIFVLKESKEGNVKFFECFDDRDKAAKASIKLCADGSKAYMTTAFISLQPLVSGEGKVGGIAFKDSEGKVFDTMKFGGGRRV